MRYKTKWALYTKSYNRFPFPNAVTFLFAKCASFHTLRGGSPSKVFYREGEHSHFPATVQLTHFWVAAINQVQKLTLANHPKCATILKPGLLFFFFPAFTEVTLLTPACAKMNHLATHTQLCKESGLATGIIIIITNGRMFHVSALQ